MLSRHYVRASRRFLLLGTAGWACAAGALRAQTPAPVLRAAATGADIRVDGLLDDTAWAHAALIPSLTMVEPVPGGSSDAATRVLVLAGPRALYIAIDCADAEPDAIVAFSRDRDADLSNEDHVRLVLDPFLSGRTGYLFAVGAGGARYDALVNDGGDTVRPEWDASWEAAVARTAGGWSVEIRIPIQSLAYRDGLSGWGLNVERRVQRRLELQRWAGAVRAARFTQLARAGRLEGLPGFVYGTGLTARPGMLAGRRQSGPGAPIERVTKLSLDASQRIGANALASLTVNTDFAETEVDTRRTNLTRFPLFFPEKRTFFVEGADIFDFGLTLEREIDVLPFFSRRIGLRDGREVPLRAGGRASGRLGHTAFGALAVRTGALDSVAPATTMFAARVRRSLFRESSLGLIATIGDPEGRPGARLLGVDAVYRTSRLFHDRNLVAGAWALTTERSGLTGDRVAWGAAVAYPNDTFDAQVVVKRIGAAFDPSLGFAPRVGVSIISGGTDARLVRPAPGLRDAVLQVHGRVVLDSTGRRESYVVLVTPFYIRLESGDRLEANAVPYGERLTQPFAIAPGVTIPPGDYRWVRYRLEATLASKRLISGRITRWSGGFYDGRLTELAAALAIRPTTALALELTAVRNAGTLPAGRFTQTLAAARGRLNLSADLTFNTLVQYDDQSRRLGSNTRLRWQFHPLGELFVVHQHHLERRTGTFAFESSQLLVKIQYALRI